MQNNVVKTIYIHAGFHKTGTSSIQATCAQNLFLLSENSIYYPTKMAINHSEFLLPMFMENPNDYYLEKSRNLSQETIINEYQEKKTLFTQELLAITEETVLLSGEDIWGMSENNLMKMQLFLIRIFPKAQIKIVLCLRNPSEYIASGLQQAIKTGFKSVPPYEFKVIPLVWATKKLATIFNGSNLIVYDFEDAKKHRLSLVGYFLENILGLQKHVISQIEILRENDSVSDIVMYICKFINQSTLSSLFASGENMGEMKFERYLSDTQALWSLKGDKFKLDKEYVKELYEKLAPELQWLRENFNIDYNFENATYTKERYKIAEGFFETVKEAFPKLSRIVRRAFDDWLCEEIKTREGNEYKELHQTKIWIEKSYQGLLKVSLDALKKQITNEIEACKAFFQYFGIENKQSYQLYYHLHLFLKEMGEHEASQIMLNNFYEKNPFYNDAWEQQTHNTLKQIKYFFQKKDVQATSIRFFETFGITDKTPQELVYQIKIFLEKHKIYLLGKILNGKQ